eukprot:gnl/TRDRNA2_/TRDRNA2_176603_c1_seq13.p1 gnl/TRDRNA2_/TRDRNA2_176603_c1~~gnl/TRDRNA2_/TRDRNA2_176603_c1_seq13.p1  ORF type:complete len:440 (+),score=34.40 gnl/TRDRNA2_/TRDRNA2_176603_c1_seq13:69-1388(+)
MRLLQGTCLAVLAANSVLGISLFDTRASQNGTAIIADSGRKEESCTGQRCDASPLHLLQRSMTLTKAHRHSGDSQAFASTKNVGLAIGADENFQRVYAQHIQSLRCYAAQQEYDFHLLGPDGYSQSCGDDKVPMMFRKHCIMKEFLKTTPAGYSLVVLDADVHAGVLSRGLEKWLLKDVDLSFYMRCTLDEIMSGNYIVRNTPFALKFLEEWAKYFDKRPSGFSSADNGALHPAIVSTLLTGGEIPESKLEDAKQCIAKYHNLVTDVQNLEPYWDFTKTCTRALGQPRVWLVNSSSSNADSDSRGGIAIWPRYSFFVVDGMYINNKFSEDAGPVMHHGVKNATMMSELHYTDVDRCELRKDMHISRDEMGQNLLVSARGYGEANREKHWHVLGKSCPQCIETCLPNFSCRPLEHCEIPTIDGGKPDGPVPASCSKQVGL